MKCVYHSRDLDGICSGAIVKHFLPDSEMVPMDYADNFPWSIFDPGEKVVMIDFSLPFDDMKRLNEVTDLIWIDHHKSAIDELEPLGLQGIRKVGRAACELGWEFFSGPMAPPVAVHFLGRYDVWDHVNTPGAEEFQWGMRLYPYDPCHTVWEGLLHIDTRDPQSVMRLVDNISKRGKAILEYKRQSSRNACKNAIKTTFEGHEAITMNTMGNSQTFASIWDTNKYDIMLTYSRGPSPVPHRSNRWTVSIYSDKPGIDCSAIAKKHGGGGHAGAAGFICEELPFSI